MTSKYLGETGNRMKGAIKIAKSLTPNIVMIDEIDKQFGSSGREEHEENARARSALLSAMEESEGIFWIATCNHPELLAPELLARFQLIFHVDLPSKNERKAIITIHLKKAGRDPKKYNLDEIANVSDGHVGRGIRDAIQAALRRSFSEGKTDLTTEYIIDAIKRSKSTYEQRKEEIDAIRVWCIKNAIDASERDIPSQTTSKSESGRGLDIMDQ
jgi:SpoVK/Ycf46/Vps4 family AAA+-type ATPase